MAADHEKFALLEEMGVEMVLSLEFSAALASMSPEEFIGELCSSCRVAEVAVGEDWHFGRDRAGDVGTLRSLGEHYGFKVTAIPPFCAMGSGSAVPASGRPCGSETFLWQCGCWGVPSAGRER